MDHAFDESQKRKTEMNSSKRIFNINEFHVK